MIQYKYKKLSDTKKRELTRAYQETGCSRSLGILYCSVVPIMFSTYAKVRATYGEEDFQDLIQNSFYSVKKAIERFKLDEYESGVNTYVGFYLHSALSSFMLKKSVLPKSKKPCVRCENYRIQSICDGCEDKSFFKLLVYPKYIDIGEVENHLTNDDSDPVDLLSACEPHLTPKENMHLRAEYDFFDTYGAWSGSKMEVIKKATGATFQNHLAYIKRIRVKLRPILKKKGLL